MHNTEVLQKKLFEKYGVALSDDDPAWLIFRIHADFTQDLFKALEKVEQQKEDLDITNIKKILYDFTKMNSKLLSTFLSEFKISTQKIEKYVKKFDDVKLAMDSTASDVYLMLRGSIYDATEIIEREKKVMLEELKEQIDIEEIREYRKAMIESKELMLEIKSRRKMDAIFFTLFGAISFYFMIDLFGLHKMLFDLVISLKSR